MKKNLLIISISFFLIIVSFVFFDWFFLAAINYKPIVYPQDWSLGTVTGRFENNLPYNKKKSEILTIGDSFIIGMNIADDETLAYKLQKLTHHKVYNYGRSGEGIQHVLFKLKNSPILEKYFLKKNPEYIIYVFISDHIRRMYCNYIAIDDRYKYWKYKKNANNELVMVPNEVRPIDYILITQLTKRFNNFAYQVKNPNTGFDFFKLYMKEIRKVLDEKYPESKFVIVVYNSGIVDTHNLKNFKTDRWNELEDMGFIVINFDTPEYDFLTKDEYRAFDYYHPSGEAWDVLAPIIAKRLNL